MRFEPFVLSTWGSYGPGAQHLWKDLVRRIAAHSRGKAREWLVDELNQGLSHALMTGVGRQLQSQLIARERDYLPLCVGQVSHPPPPPTLQPPAGGARIMAIDLPVDLPSCVHQ